MCMEILQQLTLSLYLFISVFTCCWFAFYLLPFNQRIMNECFENTISTYIYAILLQVYSAVQSKIVCTNSARVILHCFPNCSQKAPATTESVTGPGHISILLPCLH